MSKKACSREKLKVLTCFLVNGEVLCGEVWALAFGECVPHVTELRATVAIPSSDKPDLLSNGNVVSDLKQCLLYRIFVWINVDIWLTVLSLVKLGYFLPELNFPWAFGKIVVLRRWRLWQIFGRWWSDFPFWVAQRVPGDSLLFPLPGCDGGTSRSQDGRTSRSLQWMGRSETCRCHLQLAWKIKQNNSKIDHFCIMQTVGFCLHSPGLVKYIKQNDFRESFGLIAMPKNIASTISIVRF